MLSLFSALYHGTFLPVLISFAAITSILSPKGIIGETETVLKNANFEVDVGNIRKMSTLLSTRIAHFKGVQYFCHNFDRLHQETQKQIIDWAKNKGIRVD
jgi:hypothetical protein